MELLTLPENYEPSGKSKVGFDMREIEKQHEQSKKSKRQLKKSKIEAQPDDFQVDVQDPRIGAIFENPDFAIDPTNPNFKKTKGSNTLLKERLNRRQKKITKD